MAIEALRGNSDMAHVVWAYLNHKAADSTQDVMDDAYEQALGTAPVMVDDGDIEGYLEFLRVFIMNEGRKHLQRDVNAAHMMRCHALTLLGRPVAG